MAKRRSTATRRGARSRRCLRHAARPVASADVIAANRLDWHLLKNFPREFDGLYFTGGRGCPGCCTFCAELHGQEVRVKTALQLIQEIEGADSKVTDGTLRVTRWDLFKHADRLPVRDLRDRPRCRASPRGPGRGPDSDGRRREGEVRLGVGLRRGLLPRSPPRGRILPTLGRKPAFAPVSA